jgi:hypothetical protein
MPPYKRPPSQKVPSVPCIEKKVIVLQKDKKTPSVEDAKCFGKIAVTVGVGEDAGFFCVVGIMAKLQILKTRTEEDAIAIACILWTARPGWWDKYVEPQDLAAMIPHHAMEWMKQCWKEKKLIRPWPHSWENAE